MIERFAKLPSALEKQSKFIRLADDVPTLLAHPDWETPAPVVLWMHGRTVDKTLDPGRYLRWIRGGIAACAVDLPGHGERRDEASMSPDRTLYVVEQMIREIDGIVQSLAAPEFGGVFDLDRIGIGGMSAGGMAALRRLCEPHRFKCAAVESTIGDFSVMPYDDRFPAAMTAELDPIRHLDGWSPIPLLMLHSEKDEWAPFEGMQRFAASLRAHYRAEGADESKIQLVSWPETGAPNEHAGFGRVANDAKNLQLEFFQRWLGANS